MKVKKILFLFGTRPEAIKLAPLIWLLKDSKYFSVKVGVTAQHRQLLDQVLDFFQIIPDYDLNIMSPNQSLHALTANLIEQITEKILLKEKFDLAIVQGDTSTVMAGALSSFYLKIPLAHVEAGLRSGNMHDPFPEEMNRMVTSRLTQYHFCPTETARQNLISEGITKNIFITGNTVIDALLLGLQKVNSGNHEEFQKYFNNIDFSRKIILVTCHRRESFGEPFKEICESLVQIAKENENEVEIVYPVHLNPNILDNANKYLRRKNIKLITPLDYKNMIWLLNKSYLVLTDSGGVQEEAPSLGKPVLVLRNTTERMEGIEAGTALLVGTAGNKIVHEVNRLLADSNYYRQFANIKNPYGDGTASQQIIDILKKHF
ncbi:MAG TPA: UDP-N-acetylglucosamine 2-epimerase (non-hydrolyzing) [Bacteroidia bacterium]|nr:UDP-N-acetylglucosamine 2-epimerase (non-hydrolyzing) [Bacteroidia bacterium]